MKFKITSMHYPEYGAVEIEADNERDAVLNLIRLTGDRRGICQSISKTGNRWEIQVQSGFWLEVVLCEKHQP